jgi:hypothetical protein
MPPKWNGKPALDDTHRKSKDARKAIKRTHNLGFQRPPKSKRRTCNSIVSMKIKELSPEQFDDIQSRINRLMPKDRRIKLSRDNKNTLRAVLGKILSYELIAASPDMEIITREAQYIIPDGVAQKLLREARKDE